MTEQELHVINSLKGKPADFVAQVMVIIPELIQAVEESGWLNIDENILPPNGELVRIWNADRNEEMIGHYIHPFSVCVDDEGYDGDTEYDEETDKSYWPSGWYIYADHCAPFTYGHCLDIITHYKPLVRPSFLPKIEGDNHG